MSIWGLYLSDIENLLRYIGYEDKDWDNKNTRQFISL